MMLYERYIKTNINAFDGNVGWVINETNIQVRVAYSNFNTKYYKLLLGMDDLEHFYGFFVKFVTKTSNNLDYRITLLYDSEFRSIKYLICSLDFSKYVIYNYNEPDFIIIDKEKVPFIESNDTIFNLNISEPYILSDINNFIALSKKHLR